MLIAKISNEHKTHIDHMEEEFNREKENFENNEKTLKEQLEEFSTQNGSLMKRLDEEQTLRIKLEQEMILMQKTHEEEVQLRL